MLKTTFQQFTHTKISKPQPEVTIEY